MCTESPLGQANGCRISPAPKNGSVRNSDVVVRRPRTDQRMAATKDSAGTAKARRRLLGPASATGKSGLGGGGAGRGGWRMHDYL